MRHHCLAKALKIAAFVVLAVLVFGFVMMSLWNWLMPVVFGLKTIGFLQALGLLILSWILFGGLRGHHYWHGMHWRHRMFERWAQMTPEEREQFRQKMHVHWRHHHGDPPSPKSGP